MVSMGQQLTHLVLTYTQTAYIYIKFYTTFYEISSSENRNPIYLYRAVKGSEYLAEMAKYCLHLLSIFLADFQSVQ